MQKTPALLMKELKFLYEESNRIYKEDEERSYAPINDQLEYKYDTGYSYEKNHKELHNIQAEELRIKSALAKFNVITKVEGLDITIAEALVRMAQLKDEIKALMPLAASQIIFKKDEYRSTDTTYKINYDQEKLRNDLKELQRELSKLQMAVDRTNLSVLVEY